MILTAKKLTLSLTVASASFIGNAQTDIGSLALDAHDGQGFIVMKQPSSTKYGCWHYVISERTGKITSKNPTGIVQLDNITVCGKDYLSLPDSYRYDRTRDIIMTVYGQTKTTEVKVLNAVRIGNYSGPAKQSVGDLDPILRCKATCDGNLYMGQSYSYNLCIMEKATTSQPNGTGETYMEMQSTEAVSLSGNIPLPLYGFYTIPQANAWAQAQGFQYQTIQDFVLNNSDYQISPLLNTSQLAPGVVIHDAMGSPLASSYAIDYYMIKKGYGPFKNNAIYVPDPNWGIMCDNGSNTLGAFIDFVNNYYTVHPTLKPPGFIPFVCMGTDFSVTGNSSSGTTHEMVDMWEFLDWVGDFGGNSGSDPGPGIGAGTASSHNIILAQLIPFFGNGSPIFTTRTGIPVLGEKITIPAGLYNIKVAYNNGVYRDMLVEAKSTITQIAQIRDLVDARIFPVPIVGDKYSVELESSIATSFLYELWDGQNNKILSRKMEVGVTTDSPYTISVASDLPIPNGTLIHKFTFSDGSVKTINTIK